MTTKEGTLVTGRLTMHPISNYPSQHRIMSIEVYHGKKRRVLEVPIYGSAKVGEGECSKYVRMAASDLFGKSYSLTHAWDRRYKDLLVCEVGNSTLEELAQQRILLQGMILGIHNPDSMHNEDLDLQRKPVKYTHNALYLGNNKFGEPLFAEQFINAINVRTEKDMKKDKLKPIEIIDARKSKAKRGAA